nr:hypothetical protein [Allomuricauda sp.]
MDKLSSKEEDRLKRAIDEVGLEKPSKMFTTNVLNVIQRKMVEYSQPAPLISKKGWALVIFIFAGCCSLFLFYPNEGIQWFRTLEQLNAQFPQGLFDGIKISKTAVFAISLMGLFLLQLPFLLQLVNKQRNME